MTRYFSSLEIPEDCATSKQTDVFFEDGGAVKVQLAGERGVSVQGSWVCWCILVTTTCTSCGVRKNLVPLRGNPTLALCVYLGTGERFGWVCQGRHDHCVRLIIWKSHWLTGFRGPSFHRIRSLTASPSYIAGNTASLQASTSFLSVLWLVYLRRILNSLLHSLAPSHISVQFYHWHIDLMVIVSGSG